MAGLGSAAQYGKISVAFPNLQAAYPHAGAALGFAVSLVGFIGIALGVVAGLVVAHVGLRRALVGGLALGAALSLLQAGMASLPLFLASRVLEGLSHIAIVVAAPTLIAQVSAARHSGMTLTLWASFFGVAFAILALAGAPLADRGGLPALFVAHSAYMAVFAALLALRLPADPPRTDVPLALGPRVILQRHLATYGSPFISAPAFAWVVYTFCFLSLLTLLPITVPAEWRRLVIGAMPLVSIATSLTIGVALLRPLGAVRVMELGFLLSALAAFALILRPGDPILCLGFAAALGLIQGAGFAAVPELNARLEDRALANGALAQAGNIGNTFGTPVLLGISLNAGYGAMLGAAAALLLAGAGLQMLLARQRRPTGA